MSNLLLKLFSHRDYLEQGKKIISVHRGKYSTYQKYLSTDPQIAEDYLLFVGKHPEAVYIKWDKEKHKFTC